MHKQLQGNSKTVLEYIKANPGMNVNQISVNAPGTPTVDEVGSSLWALWNGRYITRSRSNIVGRGPKFIYFFKTDKPRFKRRSHANAVVAKNTKQLELDLSPRPKAAAVSLDAPQTQAVSDVEIMVAVKGAKDTIVLTTTQARALYTSLATLLGVR